MSSEIGFSVPMLVHDFSIGLRDVTVRRIPGVECHQLAMASGDGGVGVCVAVPALYAKNKRRRYPLIVLLNASHFFGSAVEMSRLMAETKEVRDCILLCLEMPVEDDGDLRRLGGFISSQLLSWCRQTYRVAAGPAMVFSGRAGVAEALVRSTGTGALEPLPVVDKTCTEANLVPALVSGLRRHLGTGHAYGSELTPLSHPMISGAISALRPLFGRLRSWPASASGAEDRHVSHAKGMGRDFEVFAVMPASAVSSPSRRYPALLVLDANIELSTVAEAAAGMARSGEIEEIMVIGLGIPRREGQAEYGFRRFEEFSPPPDGYGFDDRLGRVFRALFALRGDDARQCVGKAAQLHGFLVDELLPRLVRDLPIDEKNLGILGHSAGGTFVGYTLLQERSPFQHYASISPGIGMSGSWLMREPQASGPMAKAARRVFLCLGGDEKDNFFNQIAGIPDTEAFARQVRQEQPQLDVEFRCFDGETHSTIYAPAMLQALRSFYGRPASGDE